MVLLLVQVSTISKAFKRVQKISKEISKDFKKVKRFQKRFQQISKGRTVVRPCRTVEEQSSARRSCLSENDFFRCTSVCLCVCMQVGIFAYRDAKDRDAKDRDARNRDAKDNMVPRGLEPRPLRLLAVRSSQLSYETTDESLHFLNLLTIESLECRSIRLSTPSSIRCSIVVTISACHAEDPGSIPGRGAPVNDGACG